MRPSPRHEGAVAGARVPDRRPIGADCRRSSRSLRGSRGGRVDRAQRSGASLNTATRGKPLRLEPRTCEDAWATGAPAPQRPSRGHRRGEGSPALATGTNRTGVQRPDPEAERSGAKGRVGTGNGCGNGIGNGVAQVTYIHIFHYPHTKRPCPPDSVRGQGRECVGACGRAGYQTLGPSARVNGDFVHGIGV